MSALERNPQVPALTPHKVLGPSIDRRGNPRGPREAPEQLAWGLAFLPFGRPQRREARPVLWEVPGSALGPPRAVALLKLQIENLTKGDGPFPQKPTTQTSKRAKRTDDWASEAKAY